MFFEAFEICDPVSIILKILERKSKNTSTTPSDINKLRNVNTVRWESRNITAQPGEIDYRKSKVIA